MGPLQRYQHRGGHHSRCYVATSIHKNLGLWGMENILMTVNRCVILIGGPNIAGLIKCYGSAHTCMDWCKKLEVNFVIRFSFAALLVFLFLRLYLFHHLAFAVAVHLRLSLVFAVFGIRLRVGIIAHNNKGLVEGLDKYGQQYQGGRY